MQQLIARPHLRAAVSDSLQEAPVVALLGARQVGKTTLAQQAAAAWPGRSRLLDLEVPAVREALVRTPDAVLRSSDGLVVVDEVQRLPSLFEVLRPICDDPDRRAVFLLLGSASLDLIRGVSETLAGRILFVDVSGFSISEVGAQHQQRLWMRGGFPRAWLAPSSPAWTRWMQSFTQTFLERDIPGPGSRVSATAIGRFWRMLAHCHGQVWNAAALARSMDVSVTAVNRYRDLLAGTFMIRVLPPWVRKSRQAAGEVAEGVPARPRHPALPARYRGGRRAADASSLRCELGGLRPGADPRPRTAAGKSYFYATLRGAELDLMLLRRGRRWGFEFQVHGRAAHDEGDARRHRRSRS